MTKGYFRFFSICFCFGGVHVEGLGCVVVSDISRVLRCNVLALIVSGQHLLWLSECPYQNILIIP